MLLASKNMKTLSSRPYIRQARPADKERVIRFCQNTWEWGDYIAQVWDRWLNDPSGKLLVLTIDKLLIAVGHVVLPAPDEAWLEGLRVDPEYRRIGIATRLVRRMLAEAEAMGAGTTRFVTSSRNTPIHRMASELKFTRVATILPYKAEAGQVESPLLQPQPEDIPQVLSFLQKSTVLPAMGGLYCTNWTFHSLSTDQIKARMDREQVRIIKDGGNISALTIVEPNFEGMLAAYIDGRFDALNRLASGLRAEATKYDPQQVAVRLPDNTEAQRIFHNAGYRPQSDHPFWIFQRDRHQ